MHIKDINGDTALYHAVRRGDLQLSKLLLNAGAIVSVENYNGKTPLDNASLQYNLELAELLQQKAAKERELKDKWSIDTSIMPGKKLMIQLL